MPFAFVDLDVFDQNVQNVLSRSATKNLCVASKSVRCVALLHRILSSSTRFISLMAYSVREAVFLCNKGFDNILVAYPVISEAKISGYFDMIRNGKQIILMVDCVGHVQLLDTLAAANNVVIPICLDIEMGDSYPGLYFGVRRSSIRTPQQALELWNYIRNCHNVRLDGIMGYEAQIAGLQDHPPNSYFKNLLVRTLKSRAKRMANARRAAIVTALRTSGCDLKFVNGGGTGSVEYTSQDAVVTEVTVGSAFYSPTLFDHYDSFHHEPSAGFAIEVVRKPCNHLFTCQGGGYVASGPAGNDRLPRPWLPEGARLTKTEGAGEVQTPIIYEGPEPLDLGSPIFMRHAKAGEICERFNTLLLVSNGKIVDEVPTYRGEGQCFL